MKLVSQFVFKKLSFLIGITALISGCTSALSPPNTSDLKQNAVIIPVDHFTFTNIGSPQVAGTAFSVTIKAYDTDNSILTNLSGSIKFNDVTGTLSPSNVTFTAGVATVNFTITKAIASTAIFSVPGTGVPLNQSNSFQVNANVFSKYNCTTTVGQQTVATNFAATFQAEDAYGNLVATHTTPANIVFSSSSGGVLTPAGAQSFASGLLSLSTIQLSISGTQTISIYDPIRNTSASCNSFNVLAGPLHHFTLSTPSPITACQNTAVLVKAFDVYNNLKTDLNGAFSLTDANTSLTLNSAATFVAGTATVSLQIALAAADTLTVTSIPAGTTLNQAVAVIAGPLSTVAFSTLTNPEACVNNTLTVYAKDACGNTILTHNEPYTLSVVAGGVSVTPTSGVFSSGTSSISTFKFSGVASGVQLQGSTSTSSGATYAGTSGLINVVTPTTPPTFQFDAIPNVTACQNFSVTVRAKDACGTTISTGGIATATVAITESGGATVTPPSVALTGGVGTFNAQLPLVGTSRALVGTWTTVSGTSNTFNSLVSSTPTQIAIDAIANPMACSPFTVTARAQDSCGNLVDSYSGAATWSASLGALTPASPGSFTGGLLAVGNARIGSVVSGTTITVNTTTPVLSKVSNAFNVTTNTNPYDFNLTVSPNFVLQDASETVTASVTNVIDACNNQAADGTVATISFIGTTNLVSVGGATNTTTSGSTSFSVRGNNNGQTGLFQVQVVLGGRTRQQNISVETYNDFLPIAASSYKLATTSGTTPTIAALTAGTAYTGAEVTQVTNVDTSRLIDIRSPQTGWLNMDSDLYGGFGSNRANTVSNGLYGVGMAYAANIKKFVVFGGIDFENPGPNYRANTYLFDPVTKIWTDVSPLQFCSATIFKNTTGYSACGSTPSARAYHGMAYLSGSGKVVLFGGIGGTGSVNDTWEFNTTTLSWTQITGTMPQKRYSALLTQNTSGSSAYLFGGADGTTHYNDAWVYNGSTQTWSAPPVGGSKPSARRGMGGGVSTDGRLFVFGGRDQFNFYNDTWALSIAGNAWTQVVQTGCTTNCAGSPPAKAFMASTIVPNRSELFVFGGVTNLGGSTSDTWVLSTTSGSEAWIDASNGSRPNATTDAGAMAMLSTTQELYLVGGLNSIASARTDVWKLSPVTKIWTQLYQTAVTGCAASQAGSERCSPPPYPRTAAGYSFLSAYYGIPAPLLVYSGLAGTNYLTDSFLLDPVSYSNGWSSRSVTPALTGGHNGFRSNQSVFLESNGKLLKWGGTWNTGCRSNDTWEYNPTNDTWAQTIGAAGCGCSSSCASSPPQPTADHYGVAFDSTAARAVLSGVDAQTWEYNPAGPSWTAYASNIGQRSEFKMTSIGSGKILAFGGKNSGGTVIGDTWEYDTAAHTWTQYFPATNPGARMAYALSYSPLQNRAYLFGGKDGSANQYNDLWEYNPTAHTWTNLSGACTNNCAGPVFRYETAFSFSKQDGCLHLFGGTSMPSGTAVNLMDRWRYCPSGNVSGTTLYHMQTFDVSSMAAQLATAQRMQLFFTGAANGESAGAPIFQTEAQGYSVGGGNWQSAGALTTTAENSNTFTLTTSVSDMVNGSNLVRVLLSPSAPTGATTGSSLVINQSKLRVRYR